MTRRSTTLLIVFLDLTRFFAQSQRVDDVEIADTMDEFYIRVTASVRSAGGTLVKFIGDAALAVFAEDRVDAAVAMLFDLRTAIDESMAAKGWECRLHARAHFGSAVAGSFGPPDDLRFDVVGRAVNAAAKLRTAGFTLSGEAFAALSPDLRARFNPDEVTGTYVAA